MEYVPFMYSYLLYLFVTFLYFFYFFVQFLNRLGPMPLLLAQLVQAQINDNSHHPRAEARLALELAQPLPALYPSLLRKIDRFLFIVHHAVGARVYLVAMPRDQFLEPSHVAPLRCPHQCLIIGRGIFFSSHWFDGRAPVDIQPRLKSPLGGWQTTGNPRIGPTGRIYCSAEGLE